MNPYKVLQVDPAAEQEVIEAAYKRLASKYHPDKNSSVSATKRMQEINAAYEILKDPERRRSYDNDQEERARRASRRRAEEARSAAQRKVDEERPVRTEPESFPVEEVSNRVFKKILWAAAIIALLVYVPWLAAIVLGIWVAVWFFRKFPKAVIRILQFGVAIAVAGGLYWWRQEQKKEDELASLDVTELLRERLPEFTSDCVARNRDEIPNLVDAYCGCMTNTLRSRFDDSPITASSVYDFKDQFSSRFKAARPGAEAQTFCLDYARPKLAPAVVAEPAKPTKARKPKPPSDADRGFVEKLRGPRPDPKYDDPNLVDPAVTEALAPKPSPLPSAAPSEDL